jgi:hypothetical protein
MKTAVSVPGEIFDKAEKLARQMKKSRSRFYSDAIAEYVSRHDPGEITRALDNLYKEVDSRPHPSFSEAARRILVSDEW